MSVAATARKLSLQHISVRVPWHDNAWNGTTCCSPVGNAACLILNRIREKRDDSKQMATSGRAWNELKDEEFPACVPEHGGFMAPFEISRAVEHPYVQTSAAHAHFAPTRLRYPAYSSLCTPFLWMLRESAPALAEEYEIPLVQEYEDRAHELMKFTSSWIQDKRNQLAMLDTFYSAIQPQKSLCFFYAKQVPLSDDPNRTDSRRVLIGVGRVTYVGGHLEYEYRGEGELRSVVWERAVGHSIRPEFKDGFLLP